MREPFCQFKVVLVVLGMLLSQIKAFAHPLDISLAKIRLDANSLDGELFLNGFQLARLAQQYNLDPSQLSEESLKNLVTNYFYNHFDVRGENGGLELIIADFKNIRPEDFLATGIYIIFYTRLKTSDFPLVFYSDIFNEYASTQTTKLILLDHGGSPYGGGQPVLLTAKNNKFVFNIYRPDFSAYTLSFFDSDGDGISDITEGRFGLDPLHPDTDGDGFTDFEEFFMGWDPLNKELELEQSREKYELALANYINLYHRKPTEETFFLSLLEEAQFLEDQATQFSATVKQVMFFSNLNPEQGIEYKFLAELLQRLEVGLYRNFDLINFLILLCLIAGLGFLHALASGAGKGILLGFCLKDDREFKEVLFFSLAFSLSQLIASLGLGLLFLQATPSQKEALLSWAYLIQVGAGSVLILAALFLVIHSALKIRDKIVLGRKTFFESLSGAWLWGLVTGLAACPFLWAFLRMLINIQAFYAIPFVFLFFGLGMFAAILVSGVAVSITRYIFLDILPRLVLYSELISAVVILIFASLFFLSYVPF